MITLQHNEFEIKDVRWKVYMMWVLGQKNLQKVSLYKQKADNLLLGRGKSNWKWRQRIFGVMDSKNWLAELAEIIELNT